MPNTMRELYRSSNGDRWSLIRDDSSGKVLILHEPNAGSGGLPSRLEVGDFLVRDAHGPRHAELQAGTRKRRFSRTRKLRE
jgi:hypothetical protein